jgi:glycosyltransferase involved in cell wall biosynthesis
MGGGAERISVTVMNHLDREKYSIVLLLVDSPGKGLKKDAYSHLLSDDIEVINLGIALNKINYFYILMKLIGQLYKIKPDIIFSTMLKSNLMIAVASIFYYRNKHIIFRAANNQSAISHNWLTRRAISWMYNVVSDMNIAISDGVKNNLIEMFNVDAQKIHRIYNPVDVSSVEVLAEEGVEASAFKGIKIISIGRLVKQKDFPTLIGALALLKAEGHAFSCRILGTGVEHQLIKAQIKELGLLDRVELLGFQMNPFKFLKDADIFVLHSKWEGFGNVILEAMASGTAVIASRCPYGPEEIIGDEYGLLFEIGDPEDFKNKLVKLIEQPELRETLERKGLKRVKEFSIESAVKEYERIIDSVMEPAIQKSSKE